LLEQDTYPSWLYQVKLGATTMWERWDGYTPEKGFQDPGMNSFNHYAFGSVGEWLYRTVGGIDTDGPAYKHIIIRPQPDGKLTYARASYDSIHGQIESSWKLQGSQLTLDVSIPLNTDATIYVPTSEPSSVVEASGTKPAKIDANYAVYKVGSGRYQFSASKP
jgi:alpha-L-rhamnosidase